jgi:hypothetical protein
MSVAVKFQASAMSASLFIAARKSFISALRERSCEDLRWMELAQDREKMTFSILAVWKILLLMDNQI